MIALATALLVTSQDQVGEAKTASVLLLGLLGETVEPSSLKVLYNTGQGDVSLLTPRWTVHWSKEDGAYSLNNEAHYLEIKNLDRRYESWFFATEEEAWKKAEGIVAKIWSGPTLKRTQYVVRPDYGLNTLDSSTTGQVILRFGDTPPKTTEVGFNGVTVTFDIHDATLVRLFQRKGWTYGPIDVRLEEDEAVASAEKAYRTTRTADKRLMKVEKQYVQPNTSLGAKARTKPREARYAYKVMFDHDEVWIDAADGTLLGARLLR